MDKSKLKQTITAEIEKTSILIQDCKDLTKPIAPDCSVDHSLRMEAFAENELTLKTLRKSEIKLQNLKKVLSNIDSDSFGICLKCQSTIPIQRIIIRPQSLYCVSCSD